MWVQDTATEEWEWGFLQKYKPVHLEEMYGLWGRWEPLAGLPWRFRV